MRYQETNNDDSKVLFVETDSDGFEFEVESLEGISEEEEITAIRFA